MARVSGALTGAATVTRAAPIWRTACTAARMVAPVAMPVAPVDSLAPRQLLGLAALDRFDRHLADAQGTQDVLVEHPDISTGNRPHRQLAVAGHAQLA